jgi:hypothetical protein
MAIAISEVPVIRVNLGTPSHPQIEGFRKRRTPKMSVPELKPLYLKGT